MSAHGTHYDNGQSFKYIAAGLVAKINDSRAKMSRRFNIHANQKSICTPIIL